MSRETNEVPAVVIGAGVVGLAIARALSLAGAPPFIIERNGGFGEETSARNSEVIHAGIYYTPGSLKAQHCVEGKARLYAHCMAREIAHRRCGKLIVASDADEAAKLNGISANATANGVEDLVPLDGAEARKLEPALRVEAALLSPSTGIVDSHALMLDLLGEAESAGATLATRAQATGGEVLPDGRIAVDIASGGETLRLVTPRFVNAAGLFAQDVTAAIEGLPAPPARALVKGNYFSLSARAPFSRLIYPAPRDGGLGVHLTLDLAGRARFGPDTEWLDHNDPDALDYAVDPGRAAAFYGAIRSYWPDLPDGSLVPDYSGVRPKVAGDAYPDFRIEAPESHGIAGACLLYGIESPGLTAALSLAETVSAAVMA